MPLGIVGEPCKKLGVADPLYFLTAHSWGGTSPLTPLLLHRIIKLVEGLGVSLPTEGTFP